MNLKTRIDILEELRSRLENDPDLFERICTEAYLQNNWFTRENIELAVDSVKKDYLNTNSLKKWTPKYDINDSGSDKTVGLIMAGNIPAVGFHDLLCVFISGHRSKIKLSSKDEVLMKYIISLFHEIDKETENLITIVDRLKNIDAVIATGSNNSYRYFEYYFGKIPNIIRKNRNSVAVLTGNETKEQLSALVFDIQSFFGLGCRNVSKLFVPKSYKFDDLIELLDRKYELKQHNKYMNNYDYNLAVSLINKDQVLQGESIILKKNNSYISGISILNYEEYSDLRGVMSILYNDLNLLQLVASASGRMTDLDIEIRFGETQNPQLWDYADGVDTMDFLTSKI